jgi:hypothetical protein
MKTNFLAILGYIFVVIVGVSILISLFQLVRSYYRWKKKHSQKAVDEQTEVEIKQEEIEP